MSLSPAGELGSNFGCLWTAEARTKDEVALQWSCSPNITRNLAPPFRIIRFNQVKLKIWNFDFEAKATFRVSRSLPPYRQWAAVTTYRWKKIIWSLKIESCCEIFSKTTFPKILWNWFKRYLIEDSAPTHHALSLFVARLGEESGNCKEKNGGKTKVGKFIRVTHRFKTYDIYLSDSPKPEPGRGAYTLGLLPFLRQSWKLQRQVYRHFIPL